MINFIDLKGVCKDDFFLFLKKDNDIAFIYDTSTIWSDFESFVNSYTLSMLYGLFVDFFDQCNIKGVEDAVQLEQSYMAGKHNRSQARIFAIEKNCKRYNQNKHHGKGKLHTT